ncbi:MAG: hypothetical protein IJY04_09825 [Clostridia bacterium]|nr:hypothetical protein [Clostridia bacterium]
MADTKKITNYILYQDRPLIRNGQTLVYGSFSESAYADMIILSEKEEKTPSGEVIEVPDMIMVTIMSTDKTQLAPLRPQEFHQGLSDALEYSITQIERFNKKQGTSK